MLPQDDPCLCVRLSVCMPVCLSVCVSVVVSNFHNFGPTLLKLGPNNLKAVMIWDKEAQLADR